MSNSITLAILGCGNLGTAILSGILKSSIDSNVSKIPNHDINIQRYIACISTPQSVERIKKTLGHLSGNVEIMQGRNTEAIALADYIILGCKPNKVQDILQEDGIAEALEGKVLISICAGVTVLQMQSYIPSHTTCRIVRVMPNTASAVHQSMTVIETSNPPLPSTTSAFISWIFKQIGIVINLPPSQLDVATALCGSGPAFFALILESAIDGAVAMGLPRAEATLMASQTMKGTAEMVLAGEHPAILKDKVSSPGGCTTGGLTVLEEGAVRGKFAGAVKQATIVAGQLGNRTRLIR
ncbi:BgTH12-00067 [Blumeria graminis f. sp. triticale]|uniref:Pyrroline-5-carboxylate reductase n=3 Tax=Blumeria graminis TaxID=34373 RepID=A0A061HCF6_BLUGR|nr:Delta 1-pyrroline-5-carboxylate reductase [Blumeria graminis f. sp. tritici 96224]CAD6504558.1 BgTH12-00067 [Blumeria graminis f. sp. triticale]VDB92535.1 Bgt-764 [Blumeria graminis f. sp. tritici]